MAGHGRPSPRLRQRAGHAESSSSANLEYEQVQDDEHSAEVFQNPVRAVVSALTRLVISLSFFFLQQNNRNAIELLFEGPKGSAIVVVALTVLAFALRFYKINHPDQVVYVNISLFLNETLLTTLLYPALTKYTLANSRHTTSLGNIISTSILLLRNYSSA